MWVSDGEEGKVVTGKDSTEDATNAAATSQDTIGTLKPSNESLLQAKSGLAFLRKCCLKRFRTRFRKLTRQMVVPTIP